MKDPFYYALEAFRNRFYTKARIVFEKILNDDPNHTASYFYLGSICYYLLERDQGVNLLKKFITLSEYDLNQKSFIADAFCLIAKRYDDTNNMLEAIAYYKELTANPLTYPYNWTNLADAYRKLVQTCLDGEHINHLDKIQEAHEILKLGLECCPKNYEYLYIIAKFYEKYAILLNTFKINKDNITGYFILAIEYYRQATNLAAPNHKAIISNLEECFFQYGNYLYKQANYSEAKKMYLKALELNSEDDYVLSQLGMTLSKQGRLSEAEDCFAKALELANNDEDRSDAWLNRAYCFRSMCRLEQAKSALAEALRLAPKKDDYLITEETALNDAISKTYYIKSPFILFTKPNAVINNDAAILEFKFA